MAMGQAAGTAAALAVRQAIAASELDGRRVREELTRQGIGPFDVSSRPLAAAFG